jgi:hypothetical protein
VRVEQTRIEQCRAEPCGSEQRRVQSKATQGRGEHNKAEQSGGEPCTAEIGFNLACGTPSCQSFPHHIGEINCVRLQAECISPR